MADKRKVTLFIATSLDGYIAAEDGSLDWLPGASGEQTSENEDYGYQAFYDSIDTVLMGHATYRQILSFGGDFPYQGKTNYVFSHSKSGKEENVTFTSENPAELINKLKSLPGKGIWLNGGSKLIASFLDKGLVDDMILFIVPKTIGAGIPLFRPSQSQHRFSIVEAHSYQDGMVKLHYRKQN